MQISPIMTDEEREKYIEELKELSLNGLRGKSVQLGREIRELEKKLDEAMSEHKEVVIESIRRHMVTPTVSSIIGEYTVLGAKKRAKLILKVGAFYASIVLVFAILGGKFANDSAMVGFLALAAAVTMPIVQIYIADNIKAAEPDKTSHLLLLIAEMAVDRSSRPLDPADNHAVEKWRATLEVINKQDAGEWESRKDTEKIENDAKVLSAEVKRDKAMEELHRAAEKYELINIEYNRASKLAVGGE